MKLFLFFILLFTYGLSYGQTFEGTLTYVADFEVSEKFIKMGLTKEKLSDKMKKEGTWADTIKTSYKQGNYYTLLNTNPRSWAIYKAETNKIYSMQEGEAADICTVTDAAIDLEYSVTGKMPTIQKLDTTATVDGITCEIVRVKWKSGTYDYYYNSDLLKVNPSLYSQHKYDGWADFLKISNALPLKIVKSTNGMLTITMTLTSKQTAVLDEKIFSIPTLVPDKELNMIKIANREVMRIKK